MAVQVFKQPNNPAAPGSGRYAEIVWVQNGDILIATAVAATAQARGGVTQSLNFWALSGSPTWQTVQGLLLAKFGTSMHALGINSIPGPFADPLGVIASPSASEHIQQVIYETEVAAAAAGVVSPTAYGTAFYLNDGAGTIPTNGPGSGSARSGVGFGLNGTGWDVFVSQPLSVPFIFAQPTVNAQQVNKLALQVIRPSAGQIGRVQWWINDQKVASQPFSNLFTPSQGSLACAWFNGTIGGAGLGVRSARFIAGPLDASVYPF